MLVGDLARTEGGGRWASAAGAATEGWHHHLGRPEQSHELESHRQPHRGRGFA